MDHFGDIYRENRHLSNERMAMKFEAIALNLLTGDDITVADLYRARLAIDQAIYLREKNKKSP